MDAIDLLISELSEGDGVVTNVKFFVAESNVASAEAIAIEAARVIMMEKVGILKPSEFEEQELSKLTFADLSR